MEFCGRRVHSSEHLCLVVFSNGLVVVRYACLRKCISSATQEQQQDLSEFKEEEPVPENASKEGDAPETSTHGAQPMKVVLFCEFEDVHLSHMFLMTER